MRAEVLHRFLHGFGGLFSAAPLACVLGCGGDDSTSSPVRGAPIPSTHTGGTSSPSPSARRAPPAT